MILCGHKECLYNKDGQWCTKKIVIMGRMAVCKEVWNEAGQAVAYKQPRSQIDIAAVSKKEINIIDAEILSGEESAAKESGNGECQKSSVGQQESIQLQQ